ncbi:MAG: DUF3047 domain-containing protein [Candidatus Omnitrophota bacterium]|jgi:hypothetical protein
MILKRNAKMAAAITVCAAIFAILAVLYPGIFKKRGAAAAWREEFTAAPAMVTSPLPDEWKVQKKPGTRSAVFSLKTDPAKGDSFLHMEADNASASIIRSIDNVDISKTPVLRWRWRAVELPVDADGRVKTKDDQAIGIYAGAGSKLNNKSISYRWDTITPKGSEGNCAYGMGTIKVKWYTLRNKEDLEPGKWYAEERNVAEDFKNAWGVYPDKIYLSVSCNSQYTKSRAEADLDHIEFTGPEQVK